MKIKVLAFVACLVLLPMAQAQVTNQDVVKMVKAGIGDDIVISSFAQKTNFDSSPDALIALKGAGVSDKVIAAMLNSAKGGSVTSVASPSQTGFKVPEGTNVSVVTTQAIDQKKAKANDLVACEVAEDVKVNNTLVFPQGAPADCKIFQSFDKGIFLGNANNTTILVEYVKAVDGTKVRVNGQGTLNKGQEGMAKSTAKVAATPVTATIGFLKKKKSGDNTHEEPKAENLAPTLIRAKVAADKEINQRDLTASVK